VCSSDLLGGKGASKNAATKIIQRLNALG
jgi:hypothetical protein